MITEDASNPMHGGLMLHYAGNISRQEFIDLLRARLPLAPRLRQRMVSAPFGIAMPGWEDDPNFDVANHVSELTLPAPGDDRVLGEVVGQVHTRLIDRRRPMWEATVLHGRTNGTTVLYVKMHHSMGDAPALMRLVEVLHDGGPRPAAPAPAQSPGPAANAPLGGVQSAVIDRMNDLVKLSSDLAGRFRPDALLQQSQQMASLASSSMDMLKLVPSMPWNGSLGPERRVAWMEVPFAELRQLGKQLNATINDLVMAVIAGGLGRYLRQHGRTTEGLELRDMVTVSVRRPEELDSLGNRVTAVLAPLYLGIEDPLERLHAEKAAMTRIKESNQAEMYDSMSNLAGFIPPVMWQLAALPRPSLPMPLLQIPQPAICSVISSNIVGPRKRMRLGGHELVDWQGVGICMMNTGLFIVFQSYADQASFSVTVDPKLVPDEWLLIEQFRDALTELRAQAPSLS
jgi:WS/DGAT/MGAT family acyltransferase